MNTIYREGEYELVKHEDGLAPYAIFKRGEQVSQYYCTCGWASHKLKQLTKRSKNDKNKPRTR